MAGWDSDISKAPRGKYRVVPAGKEGQGARRVFERAEIIAASKCGVVCISYWDDAAGKWDMFASGEQPIAWQPFKGRRPYVDEHGRQRYALDLPAHPTMATSWFQDLLAERRAA